MAAHALWDPSGKSGTELETLLELGQGGMATAYLARAVGAGGFQRFVVLKRMNLDLLGDAEALRRFMAEARVAGRIHHANVVGTQQVGRDAAGPFIVLDYVEGGTLDDLCTASEERETRLPVPVLLRIALDVLAGLEAVHDAVDTDGRSLNILHRDVSLQNVLVGVHDGVSRLSDFGVAKSALGTNRTDRGYLVGKLFYLAPEYLRRDPVGPPLDLYALGVTLWLALTGEEPWPITSETQFVHAIVEEGVPPLEDFVDVMPELAAFVARACARDVASRFQTAREMGEALRLIAQSYGALASHADVARLVRKLLGDELAARRDVLARLAPTSRATPAPGSLSLRSPIPALVRELRPGEASDTRPLPGPRAEALIRSQPRHRSLRLPTVVLLAAAAALIGLVITFVAAPPAPPALPAASNFVPVAPAAPDSEIAPARDSRAAESGVDAESPRTLEIPSSSRAASPSAGAAPAVAVVPEPAALAAPARSARPRAPESGIRKKNPYR